MFRTKAGIKGIARFFDGHGIKTCRQPFTIPVGDHF
jgi:hypothetical protein